MGIERTTEVIANATRLMHLVKPLVFEAVLFVWALFEMGKFIFGVIAGN